MRSTSTGRPILGILLAVAVLTAGCVSVPAEVDEEPTVSPAEDPLSADETGHELPDRTFEIPYPSFDRNATRLEGNISQEVQTGWRETGLGWSVTVPGRPMVLDLYLDWGRSANRLAIRVEQPDGRTLRLTDDDLLLASSMWDVLPRPPGGTYRFDVLARDATHDDEVRLDLTWRRGPEAWIETRQVGDLVEASATWRDGTLSRNRTRVAVDLPQGNVSNVLRARDAYVDGIVRATAPNASTAIRQVKALDPRVDADNGRLRVDPWTRGDSPRIDVLLRTPPATSIHGKIRTDGGRVDLQGLTVHDRGLELAAPAGPVDAGLRLLGDLTVRAGESTDLSLGARADASLDVNATGGDVRIALPTDRPVRTNLTLDANATLETSVPGTRIVEEGNVSFLRGGPDGAEITLDGTVEAPEGAIVFVPYEADA